LSREMFGPDVPVSITTQELGQLVSGVRFIERMNHQPVDKDELAKELSPLRDMFTQSIVLRVDLPAGTYLLKEHLQTRKPGTGIAAARIHELVGARLRRNVKANDFLHEEDLEALAV